MSYTKNAHSYIITHISNEHMETNVSNNRINNEHNEIYLREQNPSKLDSDSNSDQFELNAHELSNVEQVTNNNPDNSDTCFICLDGNDEQQLQYATVCCGTTIYHKNCMEKYCEGEFTNKNKKKVTCQICHEDITDKIKIEVVHQVSLNKVWGWIKCIIWAGTIILSCIFYTQMPRDDATEAGLVLTYIFGPVISFYMMLNSTRNKDDILYEKYMGVLFTIEVFVNPLILLCTSLIVINYPNKLSYLTVNHIFIIVGCGSIGAYVSLWYLYFWLKKCVLLPEIILGCGAHCMFSQMRICFVCFMCIREVLHSWFSCVVESARACCMDNSVQYSVKNEYVNNNADNV
jgi:hypothetical protein